MYQEDLVTTELIDVKFLNTEKTYGYLNDPSLGIRLKDFVIVPAGNDFTVGVVVAGTNNKIEGINYKKVAYRIDLEKFKKNYNGTT